MTSPNEHPEQRDADPAAAATPTEQLPAGGPVPPGGMPHDDGPEWMRQVRRLRRRRGGRVVAGVAGGLADYLRIDPVLVRLAFVALTPFALAGLVIYLVLWAFVPAEGAPSSAGERILAGLPGAPAWIRYSLLVLAVIAAVAVIAPSSPGLLLVLVVIAVLLGRDRDDHRAGNGSGAPAA